MPAFLCELLNLTWKDLALDIAADVGVEGLGLVPFWSAANESKCRGKVVGDKLGIFGCPSGGNGREGDLHRCEGCKGAALSGRSVGHLWPIVCVWKGVALML